MKLQKSIDSKNFLFLFRLLTLGGFLLLAFLAARLSYFEIDFLVSRYLQSFQNSLFSPVLFYVSELGNDFHFEVLSIATISLFFFGGHKKEALRLGLFTGGTALLGTWLKTVVNRPRPLETLVKIQDSFPDQSFPSLHVLVFTVFFGYLFYLSLYRLKPYWLRLLLGTFSYLLVLIIGLSRIYLGAHWASDVLGGYLLGFFILSFTITHAKR